MATQKKEYGPPGKEKRGISPSNPRHIDSTHRKSSSPNSTAASSPDPKHVSTPSEKRVPNYLKPTASSALDPSSTHGSSSSSKQASSNSTTTAQKPNLNRRRSFDKPPSPSRLQKAHTFVNPSERNIRSSSSSSVLPKSTPLPKPHQERSLKAPNKDAGKSHSLSARPNSSTVKKSTTTSIYRPKQSNASSAAAVASTKAPSSSSPHIADTPMPEPQHEDQESSVTNVEEEVVKVESINELQAEISILEDKEVPVLQAEPENNQHKDLEPSTVLKDQNKSVQVQMLEPEDKVLVEETSNNHQTGEDHMSKEESNESFSGIPEVEGDQDMEGKEISETENSRGKTLGEKEEVNEGNKTVLSKETESEDVGAFETKPDQKENIVAAAAAAATSQGGQGKKETQAYNDVIEQTASKLLEKRKNKVKALVGAFETVISLQEPEG